MIYLKIERLRDLSQKKIKKKIKSRNQSKKFKKIKIDKSRNLFKFVSVLLSASVERVGVSRMRDFSI